MSAYDAEETLVVHLKRICRLCCAIQIWKQRREPDPYQPDGVGFGEWEAHRIE